MIERKGDRGQEKCSTIWKESHFNILIMIPLRCSWTCSTIITNLLQRSELKGFGHVQKIVLQVKEYLRQDELLMFTIPVCSSP